jgi:BMFP domain-containing protein YqiC
MATQEEIKKMHVDTSKAKRSDNHVFGTKGKVTEFHDIAEYAIKEKTLLAWFESFEKSELSNKEKFTVLKEVLLDTQSELEKIKAILAKYGME